MSIAGENKTVEVSCGTEQTEESRSWDWVERSIWTDRMLEALEQGVKGGVWFSLTDKVCRPQTLRVAWQAVKRNGGSAGTDHESIERYGKKLEENINKLSEELRTETYRPRPIKRTYIDKPGSKGKRPLGIPTIRDRVVQTAIRLVIEPIFERQFRPSSYGFRPKRSCKDALREVEKRLKDGYAHVVDADLKAYFDSIPHERLLRDVQRYIADGRMLKLIESFLKQDVLDGLAKWTPEAGTPQGAVISPVLANLYLHPVDQAMEEAGIIMIRYADDFVLMCKDEASANKALNRVNQLITERGLFLHPEKTRVVNTREAGQGFDFLGYHFEQGTRWPRKKSLKKFKANIRAKTKRSNGYSLFTIIMELNKVIGGWFQYYKHSHKTTFRPLDSWIRRRLRSILRKRIGLKGISCRGEDHHRWPNQYFRAHGLISLVEAHGALLQSSRR